MSGTVQTLSYLTGTEFVDGQAAGAIGPGNVRDVVATLGNALDPDTSKFPAILRGTVDVGRWSGVNLGSQSGATSNRAANGTAIQAACDYAVANNKFIEFRPGLYEINNAAGITWSSTNYLSGFCVRGSRAQSKIVQFAVNAPILTVGDTGSNGSLTMGGADVSGLTLDYGSGQGSQTNANALWLGNVSYSRFQHIQVGTGGIAPYNNLYISTASGSNFFSNTLSDFVCLLAQNQLFTLATAGSGNQFLNMYMNNYTGTAAGVITLPFYMYNSAGQNENVFEQLNIEWCSTNQVMNFNNCGATFISHHCEGCVLTGGTPEVMDVAGSRLTFLGSTWLNIGLNTTNTGSTMAYLVGNWGNENVVFKNCWIVDSGNPVTTNNQLTLFLQKTNNLPVFTQAQLIADCLSIKSLTGFVSIDPTLPRATEGDVTQISGYKYPVIFGTADTATVYNPPNNFVLAGSVGKQVVLQQSAALTATTTWALGHNYMLGSDKGNTVPIATGQQVVVVRLGAGAFNLVIKDGSTAGTTIGTFTGAGSAGTTQTFAYSGTAWVAV